MINDQKFGYWEIGYWLLFGNCDLVIGYLRISEA